jgi:hypothetical protein
MISVFLLTCLLLCVVTRSPDIYRTIIGCLEALPLSWATPILDRTVLWVSVPSQVVAQKPSLAPSFQRPPPLFS